MDHVGILKRAVKLTWRNRALWFFGILLALTSGGGGGGANGNVTLPANREFDPSFLSPNWDVFLSNLAGIIILIVLVGVVMAVVGYHLALSIRECIDQDGESTRRGGGYGECW